MDQGSVQPFIDIHWFQNVSDSFAGFGCYRCISSHTMLVSISQSWALEGVCHVVDTCITCI